MCESLTVTFYMPCREEYVPLSLHSNNIVTERFSHQEQLRKNYTPAWSDNTLYEVICFSHNLESYCTNVFHKSCFITCYRRYVALLYALFLNEVMWLWFSFLIQIYKCVLWNYQIDDVFFICLHFFFEIIMELIWNIYIPIKTWQSWAPVGSAGQRTECLQDYEIAFLYLIRQCKPNLRVKGIEFHNTNEFDTKWEMLWWWCQ